MSSRDPDIGQFLEIVPKLLGQHLGEGGAPASVADLRRALDESGVSDLAIDTADVPNTLEWLTATVTEVARVSPSLAFALASRYAAQRALLGVGSTESGSAGATLGTISPIGDPDDPPSWGGVLVPMLFEPDTTVLVDLGDNRGAVYGADAVVHSAEPVRRTGLRHAQLVAITVDGPARTELDPAVVGATVRDWTALTSAVSLGIAEAALHTAETYAADRRQFGAAAEFVRRAACDARRDAGAGGCRRGADRARARARRPARALGGGLGGSVAGSGGRRDRRDPGARRLRLRRGVPGGRPVARRGERARAGVQPPIARSPPSQQGDSGRS